MNEFEWTYDIRAEVDVTLENTYVGMEVLLKPDTFFYIHHDNVNPRDTVGVIDEIFPSEGQWGLGLGLLGMVIV